MISGFRRTEPLRSAICKPGGLILCALLPLSAFADELADRGEYLVHAAGCVTCHTEDVDDAVPLAGGYALKSPFGTFYSPNITPDRETGIGDWDDDDFVNAFWNGKSPEGHSYYPAFPYPSYTGMSRADILAIKAYLFSLEPVSKVNHDHELAWYMSSRVAASAWKVRYFEPGRFITNPDATDSWNRGAYLVRHLGHCGECHTPRTSKGVPIGDQEMAGVSATEEFDGVPNITPHKEDGIGRWSASDIEYFLDIGMEPDGDFTGASMADVIEDNTSYLTREDRLAIAEYLLSLPALAD